MILKLFAILTVFLIPSCACAQFNSNLKTILQRIDVASKAIASLIDTLSDQYSIRFIVTSVELDEIMYYMIQKIAEHSNSPLDFLI